MVRGEDPALQKEIASLYSRIAAAITGTDDAGNVSVMSNIVVVTTASNIPTILTIDGKALNPPAPTIPNPVVETVLTPGTSIVITGTGFNNPLLNLFTASGNLGPIVPTSFTSESITLDVPAGATTGPGSLQVVNSPYTGNVLSDAVSVVIGSQVSVTNVSQVGSTITVTGTGFSTLSVINFFNLQGGVTVVNLGGIDGSGPIIPLNFVNETEFSFTVPAGAQSGPAYVHVVNPPYIPFSSSGNDPGGAFTLVVP